MANPVFIHVTSTGDIWASISADFTPAGTVLATYKINSGLASQKLGTLSGNSGSYAASGSTGKYGKEIS